MECLGQVQAMRRRIELATGTVATGLLATAVLAAALWMLGAHENGRYATASSSAARPVQPEAGDLLLDVPNNTRFQDTPKPEAQEGKPAGEPTEAHKHCLVCMSHEERLPSQIAMPELLVADPLAYQSCRRINPEGRELSLLDVEDLSQLIASWNARLKKARESSFAALHELCAVKMQVGEYELDGTTPFGHTPDGDDPLSMEALTPSEDGGPWRKWYARPGDWTPLDVSIDEGWAQVNVARTEVVSFFQRLR